jgi:hypothetical protein
MVTQFRIIKTIQTQDLVQFQQDKAKLFAENKVLFHTIGIAFIPMPSQAGIGLMGVPYIYAEIEATEEEYNSWKFQQNLNR